MSNVPKVAYVASIKRGGKYMGSKIISWGTKTLEPTLTPCSHLCIILRKTLVIESTLSTGVRIIPYSHWIKDNKVIYSFEKPYKSGLSQYIPKIMNKMWGKPYDYAGILYFAWRIILLLSIRKALPTTNKWDNPSKRFCVEIFGEKLGMMSPIQMVAKWRKDTELIQLEWQD